MEVRRIRMEKENKAREGPSTATIWKMRTEPPKDFPPSTVPAEDNKP